MALIKCYECGAMVSDKATTCPHCGAPLAKETAKDSNNPLYRPYYIDEQPTLTFGEAIYSALIKNYVNFSGRARRSEYWYFMLFDVLIGIITYFTPSPTIEIWGQPVSLLYCLYCLVFFLPVLAVSVRRLHDIDKSGWNILMLYIAPYLTILIFVAFATSPFFILVWLVALVIYAIIMIIWMCRDSTEEENEYGLSPKYKQVPLSKPTPKPIPSPTIAEDNSSYAPTANSPRPLRGMSGAHLEAIRAIQELKEQDDSKKEIVEEIKKTHQQFLAEQERRESETEKEDKRPTPPAASSSMTDTNQKKTVTPADTKQVAGKDSRRQIWQGILQAVGAYVVFLLCLLLLGSLFPQSKGLRYYANGFYAWFGWQPFKDAPAFQQYPLIDLWENN